MEMAIDGNFPRVRLPASTSQPVAGVRGHVWAVHRPCRISFSVHGREPHVTDIGLRRIAPQQDWYISNHRNQRVAVRDVTHDA